MTGVASGAAAGAKTGEDGPGSRHFAWRGWLLALLFLALAASRAWSEAPLKPGALALVALAMAGRLLAGLHIAGHSNGIRLGEGPLAVTGPYAWSRNPLYLCNLAASAGLLLFANSLPPWGMAALFAAAVLHHSLLVRTEERHLASIHGEAWERYREVTPRWLGLGRAGRGRDSRPQGTSLAGAWKRQGGNLATTAAAVLLIWGLGR